MLGSTLQKLPLPLALRRNNSLDVVCPTDVNSKISLIVSHSTYRIPEYKGDWKSWLFELSFWLFDDTCKL